MRENSRSFGRTGPAVVHSCGCDVLPWEDCQHTAWDAGKSLQRVISEAATYAQRELQFAPVAPDTRLRGILERARQIARLAQEIDGLLAETGGIRA